MMWTVVESAKELYWPVKRYPLKLYQNPVNRRTFCTSTQFISISSRVASMSGFIAALPMYDWPECRAEVDSQWTRLRDYLRARAAVVGIPPRVHAPPDRLVRCNADMPSVPGGIRDAKGNIIAPDPSSLPPDDLDLHTLWRHPSLLLGQTCWGPMEEKEGLARHVQVVGQQDYSAVEGGKGEFYSSAIVARRRDEIQNESRNELAVLPSNISKPYFRLEYLRGKRLAYNSADSMSGLLALQRDLECINESLDIFSELIETGGHRLSIVAVAEGRADVAAIDCLTWQLANKHEPAAAELSLVGWTAHRKGLPFIASRHIPASVMESVITALKEVGLSAWES